MDKIKANQLYETIKEHDFHSYKIVEYINCGKSAAVFKGTNDKKSVAIKIFDNDLIERFGHEIQEERIKYEIGLKDHDISNLVGIFDGGVENILGNNYYFIIMEFIEGKNLKEFIESENYDQDFVLKSFNTLIEVTENLLKRNPSIAHRDIKPENIMVTREKDLVLMDLGVLKFIGANSISDVDEKQFVGTLRYAPPEFLQRLELNTPEGWRAVNLYQIGAVLHDLVMKKELFHDKIPYTNLVLAIKDEMPKINNLEFNSDIIQLIRNLLTKNWEVRNKINSIAIVEGIINKLNSPQTNLDEIISDIRNKTIEPKSILEEIQSISKTKSEKENQRKLIAGELNKLVNEAVSNIKAKNIVVNITNKQFVLNLPPFRDKYIQSSYLLKLNGNLDNGFSKPLYIFFQILNDENLYSEILGLGFSTGIMSRLTLNEPSSLIQSIKSSGSILDDLRPVFIGIIDLNDLTTITDNLTIAIAKLISKAITKMKPDVDSQLQMHKKIASGERGNRVMEGRTVNNSNVIYRLD